MPHSGTVLLPLSLRQLAIYTGMSRVAAFLQNSGILWLAMLLARESSGWHWLWMYGLIRCHGQTNHDVPMLCPVLLAMDHQFIVLLIRHTHVWLGHDSPLLTQSQLSNTYWILSVHQAIRGCLNCCTVCFRVKPHPCLLYTSRCV